MKKIFNKREEELYLIVARYDNNNRLYIGIGDEDEVIKEDITVNLPEISVDKDEVFLVDDLSEDIINMMIERKIISNIGNSVQYNMGHYKRVYINLEILKEYDPSGVEEYLESYNNRDDMER